MPKIKVLEQTSDKYTSWGGTVHRVEVLEADKGEEIGYIMLGISLPYGYIIEQDEEAIYRTPREAFGKG